ncbi:hypothetical protein F5Y02DRAFT_414426 [Annulohypoxylon stygium]|nr:hypothetical protein F5Y02DRAFT_414426 [Annulohypoxylon stygium]
MATNLTALLEGPSAPPPPGVIPQLDNPPNHETVGKVLPAISIALVTPIVAMSIYSRIFILHKFGAADYTMLFAFATFIGFSAVCVLAAQIAPGVHIWDVRLEHLGQYLYYVRVGCILYAPTMLMIKGSILWRFIQVFMPNKQPRALYWTIIFVIAVNTIAYLVLLMLEIWSCKPIRKSWDPLVTDGYCLDTLALNVGAGCVNIVSDTVIFLLPQIIIWRLKMRLRQKAVLSTVFCIAILVIVAVIVRQYYTVILLKSTDTTLYTWYMGIWALVEIDFGILFACVPCAAAIFRTMNCWKWITFFRGLKSWRTMTGDGREESGYAMEDRRYIYNVHSSIQSEAQTRSYGLAQFHTMASVDDIESARNSRVSFCA